jgi:protein involved in sex pheromone biosynthesis
MDLVQKEHDRLLKRLRTSQGINNVQATIDMLQSARDTIAAGQFITVVNIAGLGRGSSTN